MNKISPFLVLALSAHLFISLASNAQGSLQFNQAKLVGNNLETVPSGKVWKVMSLYGEDFSGGSCVQFGSYYYDKILQAGFNINGNLVGVQYGTGPGCYIRTGSCSGSIVNGSQECNSSGWVDRVTNALGNVKISSMNASLPLFVPAGTTMQTLGGTTFLSVIEFNVIP